MPDTQDVLKKLKDICKKHPKPNPGIGIDSLALQLGISVLETIYLLKELEEMGEVSIEENQRQVHNARNPSKEWGLVRLVSPLV